MSANSAGSKLVFAVFAVLSVSTAASAQSVISGLVRDTSGAVLPGVSVEASSPVLIEKARSVVTDVQGRYSIIDLRPGVYRVVFTLTGFSTLQRDGIELPANFNASVNVEMSVGALEETVTVTGDSPLVDVQSSQRTVVLKREVLDALPTSRTYAAEGALAVGVKVVAQNVGGARIAAQQRLYVHGAAAADNTVAVDGMAMNSTYSNGETQPNHNDLMTQEVTVQSSSPGADVSGGGLYINLVPKEGGNNLTGSGFLGYTDSSFQAENLTQELRDRGLTTGDSVEYIYDVNLSVGGPIMQRRAVVLRVVPRRRQCEPCREQLLPGWQPGAIRPGRAELHRAPDVAGDGTHESDELHRSRVQARRPRVRRRRRCGDRVEGVADAALLHRCRQADLDGHRSVAARRRLRRQRQRHLDDLPARNPARARYARRGTQWRHGRTLRSPREPSPARRRTSRILRCIRLQAPHRTLPGRIR